MSDRGSGIAEELKKHLFTRYLNRAHGSGLGLSIVHALVVDRYRGKINLRDRVSNDSSNGTVVELWLQKMNAP